MIVPTYICDYCGSESKPIIDSTGEMPVGTMILCDCKESRAAWEAQHRADMERRKAASRGSAIRSRSIVHVGRTPQPVGTQRKHRR